MSYLFDHFDTVREVLGLRPFGLFTDVDGTISEIAPSPAEARVSPVCKEALTVLAGRLPLVAAVSGRPAEEAMRMVGIDSVVYIGNHGYERWVNGAVDLAPGAGEYPARIKAVLDELNKRISIEGLVIENKGPTAAIHYRRCRDREAALKSIMSVTGELARDNDLIISTGKLVVEIRPPLEVSKGSAVIDLAKEHRLRGALYLGDDLTDVDVFLAFHQKGLSFRGLGIGVIGKDSVPQLVKEADFTLNGVGDVERFLRHLAAEVTGRPDS